MALGHLVARGCPQHNSLTPACSEEALKPVSFPCYTLGIWNSWLLIYRDAKENGKEPAAKSSSCWSCYVWRSSAMGFLLAKPFTATGLLNTSAVLKNIFLFLNYRVSLLEFLFIWSNNAGISITCWLNVKWQQETAEEKSTMVIKRPGTWFGLGWR